MSSKQLYPISFIVNNKKIAGLTNGNETGPLLLCLHGWLDNAASFTPLMPYLNKFHVIAIDWPGHGLSDHRSEDAYYHFIDWVYDLLALFKCQQWEGVNILAHSMGGMIASAFTAAFPEFVRSLTLIDAIGFVAGDATDATKQLRKGMLSRFAQSTKQKKYHKELSSAIEARMQVSDLNKESATLLVERAIEKTEHGYLWRADSRLRLVSPYRLTPEQSIQLISDIIIPTQMIYGSKGLDFVSVGIETYKTCFKSLQLHELEGGHHVHMEQPEQLTNLLQRFINNI